MTTIHATGLMPPSFGPVRAWCGRRVPIERTRHLPANADRPITCRTCRKLAARRARFWAAEIRRHEKGKATP